MSKWWLIYKPAAMNSIWNLQVCNPPKGTPLPGTPCCFAVRLVKHTCLTVVRLEKRDHSQAGRLFRNHSDVFIETSSILKTRIVERIRQKRKIVAFVVPVVPKRIVLRYQELPAGCVTVLKSLSPASDNLKRFNPCLCIYPTSLSTISDPLRMRAFLKDRTHSSFSPERPTLIVFLPVLQIF